LEDRNGKKKIYDRRSVLFSKRLTAFTRQDDKTDFIENYLEKESTLVLSSSPLKIN